MRYSYGNVGWRGTLRETCNSVAKLGFEGIEIFQLLYLHEDGFDFRGLLDEFSLKLSSTFFCSAFVDETAYRSEREDFASAAKLVRELGARQILLSGGQLRRGRHEDDRKKFIERLNDLGQVAVDNGVELAFHPHHGTLIFTEDEIKQLLEGTDPKLVRLAIDIAHLAWAGMDPRAFINCHAQHIAYVQFKDRRSDGEFVELGQGNLAVKECHDALVRIGYDGWLAIELDASEDPLASAQINAKYATEVLGIDLTKRSQ